MYKDLKKIYDKNHVVLFNMAFTHLRDIGWRNAIDISDKEIEELEGNGMMTKEFVQDLMRLTRELAKTAQPVELSQFAQVEKLYDTRGYKTKEGK